LEQSHKKYLGKTAQIAGKDKQMIKDWSSTFEITKNYFKYLFKLLPIKERLRQVNGYLYMGAAALAYLPS
jgi:hypothetical protein